MSGQVHRSSCDLDCLLAFAEDSVVPAGLARRIVVQTVSLPQETRAEEPHARVIDLAAARLRRRGLAGWGGALAASVALAFVFTGQPDVRGNADFPSSVSPPVAELALAEPVSSPSAPDGTAETLKHANMPMLAATEATISVASRPSATTAAGAQQSARDAGQSSPVDAAVPVAAPLLAAADTGRGTASSFILGGRSAPEEVYGPVLEPDPLATHLGGTIRATTGTAYTGPAQGGGSGN